LNRDIRSRCPTQTARGGRCLIGHAPEGRVGAAGADHWDRALDAESVLGPRAIPNARPLPLVGGVRGTVGGGRYICPMNSGIPSNGRSLLITDLDNTLWDWFEAWYASFSAMLTRLSEMSGVPEVVLEREIRAVHQARGTAEYSFLLRELPSLTERSRGEDPLFVYDDAMHVLNAQRKRVTRLYPMVKDTLSRLRDMGVLIVAYTESLSYWTDWRIKHTGLDGVIDILYSSPDHDMPEGATVEDIRKRPPEDYGLKATKHRHIARGIVKPSDQVLRSILRDCERDVAESVYVGDSLMKDIVMAQSVGVLDAYAKYGEVHRKPEYDLLRRVSHWSDAAIARERELASNSEVVPTITLENSFAEVLSLFEVEEAPR
jgi:phosphoglycolate phosphatase-like HAD superfamily hydrolase